MQMTLTSAKTKYGTVIGSAAQDTNVSVFLGIPFAVPPVGALRYRAPQPPESWEGERVCDQYRPACIQPAPRAHDGTPPPSFETSEDCLYLNVWTPAQKAGEQLPVMLWIYGGGFTGGRTSEPDFDGAALARQGVILVSCAYRCGVMGFLALPEFANQDGNGAYGNSGILDQVAALNWVHENIDAFGGDAGNITIFGQSAGGMSTRMLLCSPLTKGLIRRVIVQSGGGLNEGDPVRPKTGLAAIGRNAMEHLGWTVNDLIERDADEVTVKMLEATNAILPQRELFVYQPCVDGYSIVEVPGLLIKAGDFPEDVSIMCGSVSGDSWMFSRKVRGQLACNDEALRAFAYSPSISWGRTQLANGRSPIYTYFFEHVRPGEKSLKMPDGRAQLLAPHGSDIAYIFGTLSSYGQRFAWQTYDLELSNVMRTYWTNFAKTGDPNGGTLPKWTPYTDKSPFTMNFRDDGFGMCNVVSSEQAEHVITFTMEHPGMLETLEGF
jgi:para-nitrobenzyl esterase